MGKWRKQVTVPSVPACQETTVPAASTRLPRTKAEGDMPQIAVTTGNADALDCLVRKLGIDDSEITTDAQPGRVHLFNGNGANTFASGFSGGSGSMASASSLWNSFDKLKSYDLVMFSCEGGQNPQTKSQAAMQAVHDYADMGGRLLMSHWHNIWVAGDKNDPTHGLPDWKLTAAFDFNAGQPSSGAVQRTLVDPSSPSGQALAPWLLHTGASSVLGELPVVDTRYTCKAVTPGKAEQWLVVDPNNPLLPGVFGPQAMVFTTPQSSPASSRCGKVHFTDIHVSSGSSSRPATAYPGGCDVSPLTPQEKALAFAFFELGTCTGGP